MIYNIFCNFLFEFQSLYICYPKQKKILFNIQLQIKVNLQDWVMLSCNGQFHIGFKLNNILQNQSNC